MLGGADNLNGELLLYIIGADTSQLPEVDVYTKTLVSGFTDISNPEQGAHFTSNTQDRVSSVRMPLISTAELISLPKGQAFALLEGGRLWKIRMPLPSDADDVVMPPGMEAMVTAMRQGYRTGESWWPSITTLPAPAGEPVSPDPEPQIPRTVCTPVPAGAIPSQESQGPEVTGESAQEQKEDDA